MTITLHDVTKDTINLIDNAGIHHSEYGSERITTKLESIKGVQLSEHYLYLEGGNQCAVIDNRLYSYMEME